MPTPVNRYAIEHLRVSDEISYWEAIYAARCCPARLHPKLASANLPEADLKRGYSTVTPLGMRAIASYLFLLRQRRNRLEKLWHPNPR